MNRLTRIHKILEVENRSRERSLKERTPKSKRSSRSFSLPPGKVNHGRVDVSKISSKVAQGKAFNSSSKLYGSE